MNPQPAALPNDGVDAALKLALYHDESCNIAMDKGDTENAESIFGERVVISSSK
jgi:hypothetical protein